MKKLLLLSTFALAAAALNAATTVDGIQYEFDADTKTASVTGPGFSDRYFYAQDVVVPETVTYDGAEYQVTSVGKDAFYMQADTKTITLPNSVTTIGAAALAAPNVVEITLGNNVTDMSTAIFGQSRSLANITIMTPQPPVLAINDLAGIRGNITLTVPENSLDLYKELWTGFKEYVGVEVPEPEDPGKPASRVEFAHDEVTIQVGEEHFLSYIVVPADTTDELVWESSDTEIATVNDRGMVTGISVGTTVITLTCGQLSDTCLVIVEGGVPDAVESINADSEDIRYFNLQGIEILNPADGQIVIVRKGNKTYKTVVARS